MKKILSTILVAVAFAAVSTVDAKRIPTKSMSQSESNIANSAMDVRKGEITKQAFVDTVKNEAQTPEEQEAVALIAEIEHLKNQRTAIRDQQSKQKWFGFFRNTTEEKTAANNLKEELTTVNGQISTKENRLGILRKQVSKSWLQLAVLVAKTAIAVGIPLLVIADLYRGEGSMLKSGYGKASKFIGDTSTAIKAQYNTRFGTPGK